MTARGLLLRRLRTPLLLLALLAAMLACALQLTAWRLQGAVRQALGPRGSVASVHLGWGGIELRGLRIAADPQPGAWPTADEARAARVRVRPELDSLWTALRGQGPWCLASVEVEGGYLALRRGRDGRLQLLPSLLGTGGAPSPSPAPAPAPASSGGGAPSAPAPSTAVEIDHLRLSQVSIDLVDLSLADHQPHLLQLSGLNAEAGPLRLPALDAPVQLKIDATLKGPRQDGRLQLSGQLIPASREAQLQARFSRVDLVALRPWLFRPGEGGVRSGLLDLQLDATLHAQQLHAPGLLTLQRLELTPGDGPLAGLGQLPRTAVLRALERDGRIRVRFTLAGRLDQPGFSINENLATQVAAGLAEALGVSLRGVVTGVGSVIQGLLGH